MSTSWFILSTLQCSDIEEANFVELAMGSVLSERQYSSFFVADNPYSPFGPSWEDFAKFLAKLSLGYSVSRAKAFSPSSKFIKTHKTYITHYLVLCNINN